MIYIGSAFWRHSWFDIEIEWVLESMQLKDIVLPLYGISENLNITRDFNIVWHHSV